MTTFDYYYNDIWKRTIDKVIEIGEISENNIPYFSSKLVMLDSEKKEARVSVKDFLSYSLMNQYVDIIENCLEEVTKEKFKIRIYHQEDNISNFPQPNKSTNAFISQNIDPNQTFANFVIGRSNAQANIAATTCANNLGVYYNPLFIYGNSGLGKTHLLNSIGNQVKKLYPNKEIAFISGLEFVEGVAKSAKEGHLDEFKESFYDYDLLLVDDIQFIAGKDKTHEIFFSVFNNLINNKKQVCITADRSPNEIKGLEERIISRFNQGLTVCIEAPEYETSINILKMEIQNSSSPASKYDIDDEVYNYLATNFSRDVRSLKGAVIRLLFYSINFSNSEESHHISLRLAIDAFKDQIKENKNELSISNIRKVVCDYYGLTKQQIISSTRTKNIANPRNIAMYLSRKLLDAPFKEIGDEFGKRDHTTVMSACERVELLIKTEPLYLQAINEIESRIIK